MDFAYSVLCQEIAYDLKYQKSLQVSFDSKEHFKKKLEKALYLANLLKTLNELYLAVPCDAEKLSKDIVVYQYLLKELGVDSPTLAQKRRQQFPAITRIIRNTTSNTNWSRLFVIRVKRLFDTVSPLIKSFQAYQKAIEIVDGFADPVIRYLAWVFYVPRFSINTFLILKHVVPGFWMDEHEKKLSWSTRLSAQWSRRWFEWCNDFVWMNVGLINCFWLTGVLAPFAAYLTVALYSFDMALSIIRYRIEISKYGKLLDECNDKIASYKAEKKTDDLTALARLESYRNHLIKRISYEKQKLALSIITTSALLIAMLFAMPMFYSIPIIPMIGATLVVAICLTSFIIGKVIDAKKPDTSIQLMKKSELDTQEKPAIKHNEFVFFSNQNKLSQELRRVKSESELNRITNAQTSLIFK